jgi:small subunit ribosomal protein S24e
MEIEVLDKKVNPLMNRTEVKFKIAHDAGGTPTRKDVREAIAKKMGSSKDKVVVDHLRTLFGRAETLGYAKVYKTKKDAQTEETDKMKKKHGLIEAKKKKEEAEEAKPAEGAEEKPAE